MIEYFLREAHLKFALIGFVIIWASRMNWAHLENTNTSRNTNIGPKNIAKDWNHKLFYQNKLADWKRKYECRSHPWHNHQLPRVIISVAPPGPPLSLSPQNFCQSSVIWLMEDRSVRPSTDFSLHLWNFSINLRTPLQHLRQQNLMSGHSWILLFLALSSRVGASSGDADPIYRWFPRSLRSSFIKVSLCRILRGLAKCYLLSSRCRVWPFARLVRGLVSLRRNGGFWALICVWGLHLSNTLAQVYCQLRIY